MSRAKMSDHFGFAVQRDGAAVAFTTRGAGTGPGFWFGMIFVSALAGLLLALVAQDRSTFPVGIVLALIVGFVVDRVRRRTRVFRITPDSIETRDARYEIAKVSEILWGNKAGTVQSSAGSGPSTIIAGTGAAGAAIATNAAIREVSSLVGNTMKGSLRKRGFQVAIRYGRHVVPLAIHLTEDVAQSLFHEVNAVLAGDRDMAGGDGDRPAWPETPLDGGRGMVVPFRTGTLLIAAAASLLLGIVGGSFLGFLLLPLLLVPFGVALAGGLIALRRGLRAGSRLDSGLGGAAALLGGALMVWTMYRFLSIVQAFGLNLYLDMLYESFAEPAPPATMPAPGADLLPPARAWMSTDPECPVAPAGRPASPA